ncbi:hypothetical protein MVEN_01154700 [Mycena venus]|uniref:Uncharacterized protein n=1 Tax=Mycena venus TaxID=2733690 RepID=A0A8H6Y3U4_9AGAR|nr:hypothetical protein MVEN_01154700 [Mycena venus]
MPCAGKNGQGCSCPSFQPKDGRDDSNAKCQRCKHRKKYHTATSEISSVLAAYNLARIQSKKASDEEARQETNKGFRGGKDMVDAKKGTGTSKAGSSKKASTKDSSDDEEWVKVGTLQMIITGLDHEGKPLNDKCPDAQDLEDMYERGLAVSKSPEGGVLEFSRRWTYDDIDSLARRMMKPKVGFGPFNLLDARDGIPEGESESHYVVVAKNNRKIFVKRGPITGEFLDAAKGSATSHRKYKENAVRLLVRRKIPASATKEWEESVLKLTSGEALTESETEDKSKTRGKGKAKATARGAGKPRARPRAQSLVSSPEAESSDSDDAEAEPVAVPASEPRRSSRLKSDSESVRVKSEPEDDIAFPRSPSSHSGRSFSMFDSHMDSDIEEIEPPLDDHRAAPPRLSLWTSGKTVAKELDPLPTVPASNPNNRAIAIIPPFLQPVTSSFVFDPDYNQGSTQSTHANIPTVVAAAASTSANRSVSPSAFTPSVSATSSSAGDPSSTEMSNPRPYTRPICKGLDIPQSSSNIWNKS